MSSDDIILIVKHRGFYEGYWVMGDWPTKIKDIRKVQSKFKVATIEEAIIKGQDLQTEYGIHFVNLKLERTKK